jgi:hypothetical protein
MALTRDQIRERLKFKDVDVTTSRTAVFASVVSERIKRNIVAVVLIAQATDITVEIEKLEEDGTTYTMIFDDYYVEAKKNQWIPPEYDLERPIIVLEGGTNLYLKGSAAIAATIIYWDDEL